MGLARTGSSASNGSGDYVLAFSTSEKVRRPFNAARLQTEELANEPMSGLFEARGRGDRGGDLQLDVHGDDDDRERPARSRRFRSTRCGRSSRSMASDRGDRARALSARFLTYSSGPNAARNPVGGKRPDQFNIDPAEGSSTNHTWRGEGRSGDERIDIEDKQHLQENPHDQPMIPKEVTNPAARELRSKKASGRQARGDRATQKRRR